MNSPTSLNLPDLDNVLEHDPPTLHLWPEDKNYRHSGAVEPVPGDIAACGYVQRRDGFSHTSGHRCERCLRLEHLWRVSR